MREADVGDDASSWSGSSQELIADSLSFGSQSSVERSTGYWERQMVANRASVRASLLTDGDRETYASWARDMAEDSEKTLPPFRIVRYPDLVEQAWGWERLVPYDSTIDMTIYIPYLKEYYKHNSLEYVVTGDQKPEEWPLKSDSAPRKQIANGNGLAAVAKICLEAENELAFEWNKVDSGVDALTVNLSNLIQERANSIIFAGGEFSHACAAALVCFIKEAYLILELLRRGANPNDFFIKQSSDTRMCALSLMNSKGQQSDAAAASMVGMAKEAKMMCAWMKNENTLLDSYNIYAPDEFEDGQIIRCRTLEFMITILKDSSFSNSATAVKSDNGVFASGTDHGANGNVTAASSEVAKSTGVTRCDTVERLNRQDQNKSTHHGKIRKRNQAKCQMAKNSEATKKKRVRRRKRKSREVEDGEKNVDD